MVSARIGIVGLVCGLTSACTPLDSVGKPELDAATDEATEATDASSNDSRDAVRSRGDDAKEPDDASLDGSRDAAQTRADSKGPDAADDRVDTTGPSPGDASTPGASSPDASSHDAETVKSPPEEVGDAAPAAVCTPEEAKCDDLIPMRCSPSGQWTQKPACPFACEAGECIGTCVPESTQCAADHKTRQTCDERGNWANEETCPDACTEGRCSECAPANPPACYKDTHREAICGDDGALSPGPLSRACGACLPEDSGCDFASHEYKTCNADGTLDRQVTIDCGATCTPGRTACRLLTEPAILDCLTDGCFGAWTQPGNVYVARCSAAGEWVSEQSCDAKTCKLTYMGATVDAHFCRISGGTAKCYAGDVCPQ